MSRPVEMVVNCDPAGLPRHRTSVRWNGKVPKIRMHRATGSKGEAFRQACAILADEHFETPLEGPVSIAVAFGMPRPKAHYRTGKNAALLSSKAPEHHVKKPDIDNLVKALCDGLVDGGALVDDTQVVTLQTTKEWVPNGHGRAVVKIAEVA